MSRLPTTITAIALNNNTSADGQATTTYFYHFTQICFH